MKKRPPKAERLKRLAQTALKGWTKHKVQPKTFTYFGGNPNSFRDVHSCCLVTAAFLGLHDKVPDVKPDLDVVERRVMKEFGVTFRDVSAMASGFGQTPNGRERLPAYKLARQVREKVFVAGEADRRDPTPKTFAAIRRVKL